MERKGIDMDFGTPNYKLTRKDDPETSHEAGQSVDTSHLERLVYTAICEFPFGCIQDEVLARFPNKPYSSITARFRALLDKKLIVDTGLKKAGRSGRKQRVLKAKVYCTFTG
jgi:hypothetical protein